MIRRVTECVIVCDGDRVLSRQRCDGSGHAFSSYTAAECAEAATKDGWRQLSPRIWLCPQCAKAYDETRVIGG